MATTGTKSKSKGKASTPAPDMSGDEKKAPDKPDVAEEKTVAELIGDAINEEHVRVYENGKQAADPIAFLKDLSDEGVKLAKSARSAYVTFAQRTGLVADAMIAIRKSIVLPSGLPDWGGSSQAYKQAVQPILLAAQGPDEQPATVKNRLQRRVARKLPEVIALHVNRVEKLNLDEDEVRRIVALGENATTGDEKNKEEVKNLVSHVNEHFRVGTHADNEPSSPFEQKGSRTRTTPSGDESEAVQAVRDMPQFRANMGRVSLDVLALEIVRILQEFDRIMSGKNPSYGKGRPVVAELMGNASNLARAIAKKAAENELTKDEREAREKALAIK